MKALNQQIKLKQIPQPTSYPLLANLLEIDKNDIIGSLTRLARVHGEIYQLSLPTGKSYIVSSQRLVNELSDDNRFRKAIEGPLETLRSLAGDGLFTAYNNEPNWIKAHRILVPAFAPLGIREMFPQMLDIAEQLMLKWERMESGSPLDVSEDMTRLTLDTIALCAFDYRFNSFYKEDMHPFVNAMVEGLIEAGQQYARLPIQNALMFQCQNKYRANIEYMNKVAYELIQKRKGLRTECRPNDLLNRMLTSEDPITGERLSDENIRYQMITFLIAGHETTSGLLSFALYQLVQHPKILAKAQEVVDSVLGNKQIAVTDLPKLRYLDQILKETLRLIPTAPAFTLESLEDTIIGNNYQIKKGDLLEVLIPELHRDKSVWGEDVERFSPERFSEEKVAQLPPNSWKPFGTGQRACIGRPFAMQEAIIVLAMILQRFNIELYNPNYNLKIKETLTLKPEGFQLKVTGRKNRVISNETAKATTIKAVDPNFSGEVFNDPQLQILYGSNSGSAQNFALELTRTAQRKGYTVTLGILDDFVKKLSLKSKLIIVTSSYEGEPTNNAKAFVEWLKSKEVKDLKGINYTVFGCGNKDWSNTYQAVPRYIYKRLAELGGHPFLEQGEANAKADFFGDFEKWADQLWQKLEQELEAGNDNTSMEYEIEFINQPDKLKLLQQTHLKWGEIIENRELVNMQHRLGRSKKHIKICLPKGMSYCSGDYLNILPVNNYKIVERVLKRFNLNADEQILIKGKQVSSALPINIPIKLIDILQHYVELAQPISRKQLQLLAENTACPPERMLLERWAREDIYNQEVSNKRLSILDVLEKVGACEIKFEQFLMMLPPMKIRQYSISSSPTWNSQYCTLTVAIVKDKAWSGQGEYQGVASNYLANLKIGNKLLMSVQSSKKAFHLPENPKQPIIMIAAGSGIAPFRGFIQERAIEKKNLGPALLFFGCDHPEVDLLYKDEIESWREDARLETHYAFTYLKDGDIKFVQDRLWGERKKVIQMLDAATQIYVCGDGKYMAPAVQETLTLIYKEWQSCSLSKAQSWMEQQIRDEKYVLDAF